ncbi:MAG TPA: sugar-binding protein, partial [Prolixibacteraceae bacterium]|nr:sugar-binding protein [Prolixibacteraceae bacterium]
MKKIFTLLLSIFVVTMVWAQAPEGEFAKFETAPEIDGVVDDVWTEATVYNIDKPYREEVPTVGEEGETTWQGGWVEGQGVYILLKVTDDAFYPHYAAGSANSWEYDKPEIYFDVNFILEDGRGAGTDGTGNGSGHYQIAPGFTDGSNDGTPMTQDNGVVYAFMVDGTNYIGEYFIPFTLLLDGDGNEVAKTDPIGFDVTIIDRDPDDTARR